VNPDRRCPCHSRKKYKRCCAPFHKGRAAPSPQLLMRSRFAAYALGLVDYVIDTTDPSGPQWVADREAWRQSIERFSANTTFQGLRIEGHTEDTVAFHATLEQMGQDASFRENSRFVQQDGRWLYHGAVTLSPAR